MKRILGFIFAGVFVLNGCSTATKEGVRYNIVAAGVGVGAASGAVFAPKDEKREVHALNWAGIIGLLAALYSMVFHSDKEHIKKVEDENYKLKNTPDFKVLDEFQAELRKPLYRGGPTEGKWQYRKVNRWIPDGEDRLIHQDREFIRIHKNKEKEKKKGEKK